jgi:hypothetical protein
LGDHPFLEALFSHTCDVVSEEEEEQKPENVCRQDV